MATGAPEQGAEPEVPEPEVPEPEVPETGLSRVLDGRRLRGERSREGVIDAILDLLHEGIERPTASQIAERSGVSVRSVFRHFDDVETLYAAAVERHSQRLAPLVDLPTLPSDLDARAVVLAEHRACLYEAMGFVRRVAERLRRSSPVIAERLELVRVVLRDQMEEVFGPELSVLPPTRSEAARHALEAVSSWYAWEELTVVQGCDRPEAVAAMAHAIRSVVFSRA